VRKLILLATAVAWAGVAHGAEPVVPGNQAEQCAAMTKLALPQVKVASATIHAGQPFKTDLGGTMNDLPPFCRVQGEATPTARSQIGFEVWLPLSGWNGRYVQVGNGGLAGVIFHEIMVQMLERGYAVAGTDNGHKASPIDGSWAIGEPEKVRDFAERAIHVTNGIGRRVTAQYYGSDAKRNYFFGCSEGGREALIAAQRFPQDFHGIVAGAPAGNWTDLLTGFAWAAQALHAKPETFVPADKLPGLQAAALEACDAQDGLKDGLVSRFDQCKFDPQVLACGKAPPATCLTAPQIDAVRKLYAGPVDPNTGKSIAPGYVPSGENEFAVFGAGVRQYQFGVAPGQSFGIAFANGYFGGFVFERKDWDYRSFDFSRDVAAARGKLGTLMDATNPDLSAFKRGGGKLIQYHGLLDGSIPPAMSTAYYESVVAAQGSRARTEDFYRLFLAPGVLHCTSGPGPNAFGNLGPMGPADADHDTLLALERWVEQGVAPKSIVATKYVDDDKAKGVARTRPLCPYPQNAQWDGKGSIDSAASFSCVAPGK